MKRLVALFLCFSVIGSSVTAHAACRDALSPFAKVTYETIEGLIRDRLRREIDGRRKGHEGCPTIFCPDANWRADVTTNFEFTKCPLPEMIPRGPSQWIDGFNLKLDPQVEVTVNINAYIAISGGFKDINPPNWPIKKRIGLHFEAIVFNRPTPQVQPESFHFSLTDDGGNIEIGGLGKDITILGIESGIIVGLVLFGNPLLGGFIGAVIGNIAARKAQNAIERVIRREVSKGITNSSFQTTEQISRALIPEDERQDSALGILTSLIGGYLY